jgi:predicted DNA-binding transcriptional regulator YafY
LRLLETGCYSPEDLARHFGVSKRTVYRDLRALARAEVPLVRQAGDPRFHVPGTWPAEPRGTATTGSDAP